MRHLLLLGLIVAIGCQGVVGPGRRTLMNDRIDDPCLSIDEQKVRARERIGLPDGAKAVGPTTDADFNPFGKGR